MKIALAQMKLSADMDENYEKAKYFILKASEQGAKLVCFPEVQLSPFFAQYEETDVLEYIITKDSRYVTGLCELCKELEIYISPNFYIEEHGRCYDMSLLIDDAGRIIGSQKMVHVAQCPYFYEQSYYTPSEEGFQVFDTPLGKIGIAVCFDRHYPESIRTLALRGAELIIVPTANTKAEPAELFQWEIRVQSFQNSVNIAMCNRVGTEDKMDFSGLSIVSDYEGRTVAIADDCEQLMIAEVDLSSASHIRRQKPYMCLRRPELYE